MSKRSADDGAAAGGQPPIKKVQFEPHLIGPVSTLEELDIKVLQFQNKKLAQVNCLHFPLVLFKYHFHNVFHHYIFNAHTNVTEWCIILKRDS